MLFHGRSPKPGQDGDLPAARLLEPGPFQDAAGPCGHLPGELGKGQGSGVHREFECEKPIDGTRGGTRVQA